MIWPWVVLAARVDSSTRQKTKMNICLNSLYGNRWQGWGKVRYSLNVRKTSDWLIENISLADWLEHVT